MKNIIAILLVACVLVSLCACGVKKSHSQDVLNGGNENIESIRYEDILIKSIKIGDPLSKAEHFFGLPTFSKPSDYNPEYKMLYTYNNVTICGLSFQPLVWTGSDGKVVLCEYLYESGIHSAAYEEAYEKLLNNYTRILGKPDTSATDANDTVSITSNVWYLDENTAFSLLKSDWPITSTGEDNYTIDIELCKIP